MYPLVWEASIHSLVSHMGHILCSSEDLVSVVVLPASIPACANLITLVVQKWDQSGLPLKLTMSSSISHAHTRTCTHVRIHAHAHMCTHAHICTSTYTHSCTHAWWWTREGGSRVWEGTVWCQPLTGSAAETASCCGVLQTSSERLGAGISSKCLWNILKPSTLSPISCCPVVPYGKLLIGITFQRKFWLIFLPFFFLFLFWVPLRPWSCDPSASPFWMLDYMYHHT